MEDLIKKIVLLEWAEFQQVNNRGGRASCQDDWENFEISRRSQYRAWSNELLESYFKDLETAKSNGRNLLAEKYARMMESTIPKEYEELKRTLPVISPEMKKLIEIIIRIQLKWTEELAKKYPNLSGKGRSIYSHEDREDVTSFETYLRGELETYSKETIDLYYEYVQRLEYQEKNLNIMIMENTVYAYGYDSLETAEKATS